jgi:Tfp pilus assembly protein PilF
MTESEDKNNRRSSNETVWYDDVAGNLDTFARLSKAGHFSRADQYFRRILKPYSDDFPVAAQYADSLIDQGAFNTAEDFLVDTVRG